MSEVLKEYLMIRALEDLEGLEVSEAQLTYAQREKLPSDAFCGPQRSYPAHDAKHVRAGIQRLSQFGGRMSPATRSRIFACLKKRAKKFGIEISEDIAKKLGTHVSESEEWNTDRWINWYEETIEENECKNCEIR